MRKKFILYAGIALSFAIISCSSKKSASTVAQKWCDLNGKAHRAEGSAKEAAEADLKKYENDMEAKYKNDKAFLDQVGKEVEKCEAASEGK